MASKRKIKDNAKWGFVLWLPHSISYYIQYLLCYVPIGLVITTILTAYISAFSFSNQAFAQTQDQIIIHLHGFKDVQGILEPWREHLAEEQQVIKIFEQHLPTAAPEPLRP